ncbi:hypothetical protein G7Y89_g3702 [Cudoniella acicularis]|uniref:Uncharacterized protein n=1 Tax=Cudoniella acicularis TaxID=354080 RepID=A0A8H4W5P7_9HELO|nr:hypothetical protein G7Y89_g3702 [Cudoniella acicularis]
MLTTSHRSSSAARENWAGFVQQILEKAQGQLKAGTLVSRPEVIRVSQRPRDIDIPRDHRTLHLDTDEDDLLDTLKTSKKASKRLESIFKDVAPAGETPRLGRYQAAVRGQGKDRVEVVLLELLKGANELVEDELVEATAEQAKALCDVVEDLEVMEPSAPEDGKARFFYSGSGDQTNNTSTGTQNINKGCGNQNMAKTIRIGK